MGLLVDREIKALVAPGQPTIPGQKPPPPLVTATSAEIGKWDSKIQPASLDLTIGRILLPTASEDDKVREEPSISLGQGETVVVETHEYLNMPRTAAAIGFPPATVSRNGLLMTNPGHIDPGFHGRLQFTVINLGRQPIELASGSPICTLLIFSIPTPDHSYDQLDNTEKPSPPSQIALLGRLSKDFLNFGDRIKETANTEVKKAQITIPIITGIVAVLLTVFGNMAASYISGVSDLKAKVAALEKALDMKDFKARIENLEKKN
ncbi:dCTP deaminase [Bradyrhizobium liaoningense]